MRTLIKTPKAITKTSPYVQKIIRLSNLGDLGYSLDCDDITMEDAYYINYFGTRRQQKELQIKFEALFKGLGQLAKGLFKR